MAYRPMRTHHQTKALLDMAAIGLGTTMTGAVRAGVWEAAHTSGVHRGGAQWLLCQDREVERCRGWSGGLAWQRSPARTVSVEVTVRGPPLSVQCATAGVVRDPWWVSLPGYSGALTRRVPPSLVAKTAGWPREQHAERGVLQAAPPAQPAGCPQLRLTELVECGKGR